MSLAGGTDEAVKRLEPVIEALSTTDHRYPTPAQAYTAKLTTNLLLLVGMVALAECFALGSAGGLAYEQLCELLGESPLLAPGLKNRLETVLSGSGPTWWSLALAAKDARLALQLAQSANEGLAMTATARDGYAQAVRLDDSEDDNAESPISTGSDHAIRSNVVRSS